MSIGLLIKYPLLEYDAGSGSESVIVVDDGTAVMNAWKVQSSDLYCVGASELIDTLRIDPMCLLVNEPPAHVTAVVPDVPDRSVPVTEWIVGTNGRIAAWASIVSATVGIGCRMISLAPNSLPWFCHEKYLGVPDRSVANSPIGIWYI